MSKVKWKTEYNLFPEMIAKAKAVNGTNISVGVKGESEWLAAIHEYGCNIPVTPKMRAYLHSQGLHLRADTKFIVIPERSFLRSGFDDCHVKAYEKAEKILPLVIEGKVSENTLYELVGTLLRDGVKNYAVGLSSPPNHPFTVSRKGSSNPLVDTGDMINSIEYEVEDT